MKKVVTTILVQLATVQAFAQNERITAHPSSAVAPGEEAPIGQVLLPILFMAFLIFMLITLIRYFLEFRLKSKLIDRGMTEQLSAYLLDKNDQEKQREVIKLAILFCGVGAGLSITYLTTPIHIHSLAIMAFSLGLSHLAYFFYLRR
jgi:hypothetical protein